MEILFISNALSPYYHNFCEMLGKELKLTVLYERRLAGNRDLSWGNLKEENYRAIYLKGRAVGEEMAFCPEVIGYIRKGCFDFVVLHNYLSPTGMLASLYMQIYKIPFAIHADGAVKKVQEKRIIRVVKRFFVSKACAYFSSGRVTDEYFTYYGADARRIYRYPFTSVHAADILAKPLSGQEKQKLRELLGLGERLCGSRLVLYVGSIIHRKGVDLLLRCAEQIGERAEFLIIGGEPTPGMKQWIKRHGIMNVTFCRFEPPERIKQYMRCADLFVFPTRYDIWGLVINEAMAAGLPIITTDQCVSGIELVEREKNGLLVHADNVEELTQGTLQMLSRTEDELMEIGKNNLGKMKGYSLEQMVRVYKKHLFSIAGKNNIV